MRRHWDSGTHVALDPASRGLLEVAGGPGTGKTTLLIDAAVAHVSAGTDPQSVLMLTGSGRAGARTRTALTRTLLEDRARSQPDVPPVIGGPLVRTVHSYAFAVLRLAAQRAGDPPPRLVTGAEQDSVIRELLAGDGVGSWPESLHAALGTAGFAGELRSLLARCAERGIDPAELDRLGRRFRCPEWTAAGRFAQQYEQVMLLRAAVGRAAPQATVPALGAAELVGAALDAFAADQDLLAAEHARIRVLLVDDAQQLDPLAARLVQVLATGAELTVVAADPNQAVFGFRGAEPTVLCSATGWHPGDSTGVALTVSHRCSPAVARAIRGVAGRLPGGDVIRRFEGSSGDRVADGSVTVRLASSGHAEAALIADTLRRAHLVDGVPWSRMAVIVRSVPRAGAGLPRALGAAGVPVVLAAPVGSLSEQPAVAALLAVLTAAADGLDGRCALQLLTGPIGRVDPISLRQLQRAVRRAGGDNPRTDFADWLVAVLSDGPDRVPPGHARPLRRLQTVLKAAARSHRDGRDPHYTLWQAWCRSGLQQRWLSLSRRGGPAGAQADRDLAAVTALFDVAEQYVPRTPAASLRGLVEHVAETHLPMPAGEPAPGTEAVSVLSAHSALGNEWDLVVIAGLQEGLWPNTVPRGGVLNTQRLLDVLDGVGENASARAPLLAEERRLLVAAMGRARHRLVVTAVDGEAAGAPEQVPSGFFTELTRWDTGGADEPATSIAGPSVLSAAALVGRLRGVVCAPEGAVDDADRDCAARQLARLAADGVVGADPRGWHGMAPVSTDRPLRHPDDEHLVTLSPSSLQTLIDCPLRWLAERHGGADGHDLRSTTGSVLHALIAEPGRSESELLAELDRAWQQLPFDSQWYSANELARHRAMVQTFVHWRNQTRNELTEVGVEVDVDTVVDGVRLRGRVDRIERDAADRRVVVDVKTGKTPVSKNDAQQHAQLAVYQLTAGTGPKQPDSPDSEESGGARLVYLGKPGAAGATEREQDPLTPETRDTWRGVLAQAAAAASGPRFIARVNEGCRHCPIRSICPAHTEETRR